MSPPENSRGHWHSPYWDSVPLFCTCFDILPTFWLLDIQWWPEGLTVMTYLQVVPRVGTNSHEVQSGLSACTRSWLAGVNKRPRQGGNGFTHIHSLNKHLQAPTSAQCVGLHCPVEPGLRASLHLCEAWRGHSLGKVFTGKTLLSSAVHHPLLFTEDLSQGDYPSRHQTSHSLFTL